MYISNLQAVIDTLSTKLPEYLEKHLGFDPRKKTFNCINPEHHDGTPSCHLDPHDNFNHGKCFGCGIRFNIFDAAWWLEGLPRHGASYVDVTITTLAEKFNIQLDLGEPTEEEKVRLPVYHAYKAAEQYVISQKENWTKEIEAYLALHNWTKKSLAEHGVGVGTRAGLIAYMENLGWKPEFLLEIGLLSNGNQIIDENRLIFTIYDHKNRPVAFSSRGFVGAKYVNSPTTLIYQKSNILYGFNWANRAQRKLIVTEGYGDVLSAKLKGLNNVVAVCGTALTDNQILMIQRYGYTHINLCFDFDAAGQMATEKAIHAIGATTKDLNIHVIAPETTWKDLGEFIEHTTVDSFNTIRPFTAFEWVLKYKKDTGVTGVELANTMIPILASQPNAIMRETHSKLLAASTDVSLFAIEAEVKKLSKTHTEARRRAQNAVLQKLMTSADTDPEVAIVATQQALEELEDISKDFSTTSVGNSSFISMLDKQYEEEKIRQEINKQIGFKLPLMPGLEKIFSDGDDWTEGCLFLLGGEENTGKSSYLSYFGMNVISAEENDAMWICFTIDDTGPQIIPKLVCVGDSLLRRKFDSRDPLTIGNIRNINTIKTNQVMRRRDNAYNLVKDLASQERLILKDARDGNTLAYLESVIRYYRRKYPSRKLFITVDNTHNLQDYSLESDKVERYKRIANLEKSLCNKYNALMFATVEYVKHNIRESKDINNMFPDNNQIAETRALKYLANLIAHLYNDIHSRPNLYDTFHTDPLSGNPLPRILMRIGKTKFNGFKGIIPFDFFPGSSTFCEVSVEQAKLERTRFLNAQNNEEEEVEENENW